MNADEMPSEYQKIWKAVERLKIAQGDLEPLAQKNPGEVLELLKSLTEELTGDIELARESIARTHVALVPPERNDDDGPTS